MAKTQVHNHSFPCGRFPPYHHCFCLVLVENGLERSWKFSSDFVPWPLLLSFFLLQSFAFPILWPVSPLQVSTSFPTSPSPSLPVYVPFQPIQLVFYALFPPVQLVFCVLSQLAPHVSFVPFQLVRLVSFVPFQLVQLVSFSPVPISPFPSSFLFLISPPISVSPFLVSLVQVSFVWLPSLLQYVWP